MTRSIRSESMRVIAENRFIDSFHDHSCHFLDKLVISALNTERSLFTVILMECRLFVQVLACNDSRQGAL